MAGTKKGKKIKIETRTLNRSKMRDYTMIIALIIIAAAFQMLTGGTFLNARNVSTLIRQMSIIGIISTGMLMLIVSGNFDLSVGSIVLLAGGTPAILQVWFGWNTFLAIIAALAVGCLLGAWQGFWVAYRDVPSFIVTLGGMMIFKGIYLVITNGVTIGPLDVSFTMLSQGFVGQIQGIVLAAAACAVIISLALRKRRARKKYGFQNERAAGTVIKTAVSCILILAVTQAMNSYKGIPYPVMLLAAVVLVIAFLTQKTIFGRMVFAIGGNYEAAVYSGIKVRKVIFSLFVISGFLSAVSGILSSARLNGATASAGSMFEMDAIAGCVIGGTSLNGGKGSIAGAMIGTLIMASLDNGMSLMNISSNYQYIVKGLVLILAVWMDVRGKKQK